MQDMAILTGGEVIAEELGGKLRTCSSTSSANAVA